MSNRSRYAPKQIVDLRGGIPPLSSYWFSGQGGATTLKGFFVDESGTRQGPSVSLTINQAGSGNPVHLNDAVIPVTAVGFRGVLAAACYLDISDDQNFSPDFNANYTQYPVIPANTELRLGRVAAVADGPDGLAGSIVGYVDGIETLLAAAVPAGEFHIGEVGGNSDVVSVTFSLDTAAYASGDLLADTQVISACMRANDKQAILHSLTLVDADDQGVAMYVVLLSANVTLGTENSAPSISDANAANILGVIPIAASDWLDLGGCRVANLRNLGLVVEPASGTDDLYVALVNGTGTPTFTASGIVGRFGFLRD